MSTQGRLAGKIALITGASRGIGSAVAERYAQEGAHIIALARNIKALEALDDRIQALGGTSTLIVQDLNEHAALHSLAPLIAARFGRLDILVLNAAMLGPLTPFTHLDPAAWQRLLNVNLTANFLLLKICDPLLQQSKAGRVLAVTSGVAQDNRPFWGPYATTKTALEQMILTYAAENTTRLIKANLVSPGPVATAMRAEAMPGEDPTSLRTPASITETFVALAQDSCQQTGSVVKCVDQEREHQHG